MDTVKIPLSRERFATIDAADWDRVKGFKWSVNFQGYVHSHISGTKNGRLNLHRLIMGCEIGDGLTVDHVNGDRLDNRRSNLRICTKTENGRNSKKRSGTKFPYKGVATTHDGKYRMNFCMGGFETPEEAARTWDKVAQFMYGEFARLNFPQPNTELKLVS